MLEHLTALAWSFFFAPLEGVAQNLLVVVNP